jgi:hypothetical protein
VIRGNVYGELCFSGNGQRGNGQRGNGQRGIGSRGNDNMGKRTQYNFWSVL